jgi:hypothetical protein
MKTPLLSPRRASAAHVTTVVMWMVAVALATVGFASCLDQGPECVPGDRLGCRCADGTYGFATCSSAGHYGPDAACDCVIGLTPDAGE